MSNIGVDNGIVSIKGTNTKVESGFSLVGKTSADMSWVDLPGSDAGGDLVIAPSGLKDSINGAVLYNQFGVKTLGAGVTAPVDGALQLPDGKYSANYYGGITGFQPTPAPSAFLHYTGSEVAFSGATTTISITNNNDALTIGSDTDDSEKGFISFKNYITAPDSSNQSYRESSTFYGIRPSGTPSFTGVTDNDKYPTNCIWFQPMNTGQCFIAFAVEKMNDNAYVSIYRYKRTSTGAYTDLQELVFEFKKAKSNLANGNVVLFDLLIDDLSYEYCIGTSTVSTTNPAYFFFLKLAGADKQGGSSAGETEKVLEKIEFCETGNYPEFDAPTYAPPKTHLYFSGVSTAPQVVLNFCESGGFVQFRDENGIIISEKISSSPESNRNPDFAYPLRDTGG